MQMRKPTGIFLVQSFCVLPFALAQPARDRASQGTKPPRSQTIRHKNISVHWLPPHNNLIITAVSHQDKPVTGMGTTDKGFSPSNAHSAWNNTRNGSFSTTTGSSRPEKKEVSCPSTARDWRSHKEIPFGSVTPWGWLSVELFSPFNSSLSQHSYGDNCLYLLDLYPTMVMVLWSGWKM